MLLASCSYEDSRKYNSKIVLVSDEKSKKKPEEVFLNIVTDDLEEVFERGLGVARCITTNISPMKCPEDFKGNIFRVYNYGDDLSSVLDEVEGVVPLLVLPDDFSDMRELYNIMMKYPTIRATGGNLLEIPGIRIGRYDKGKEKMTSVFNGVYDIHREVDLEDIQVQRVMSKASTRGTKSSKSSSKKPSSKNKKTETFSKFFGGEMEEF